jgi:hypothetical protein
MIDSSPNSSKLDLMAMGTRYEHYSELRDLFAVGIEIITNMHVKTSGDAIKKTKLEGAVELLEARLNLLSDYIYGSTYGSKLRGVIDGDVDNLFRTMQRERKAHDEDTKPDGESPADNSTK